MTISLKSKPTDKVIELGGGANPVIRPNVDVRPCQDANGNQTVDFLANFEEPLPIQSDEWDGVFARYVIEHLSWRKLKDFLKEVLRILKPGGKFVAVTANTEAQFEWVKNNPDGWDGKGFFESASCKVFGDQDYPENTHKNFMTPTIAKSVFSECGFTNITTTSFGARDTDMVIEAVKSPQTAESPSKQSESILEHGKRIAEWMPREEQFDKHYFNGGGKVGGYPGIYRDEPVNELVIQHILNRRPESVLELGCARGYILKRLQDRGIPSYGMEISKHCYMTRVADGILQWDLCKTPWEQGNAQYDLCFSIATLEHVPESVLPDIIREMVRVSKRGLHGIDFGIKDDGFDKTHCTLKSRSWWDDMFKKHAPKYPVEIFDKEELERGEFPKEVLIGDGKVKLNIGSFTTMFHHGWTNMDVHDLAQFAQAYRYNYQRYDVTQGLPHATGTVDLIYCGHMLEHLDYVEGLAFLRECRRVLKSQSGAMRIIVPDAQLLMGLYAEPDHYSAPHNGYTVLSDFDEINDGCASCPTQAGKLWALLHEGHKACYDEETLVKILQQAGFQATPEVFRNSKCKQILKETLDTFPCLSLFVDGIPA